ncbi:hypothetical protein WJX74_002213 [Apatococcus lobatus]|uniref:Lon protease homolog n=1 Tax=Apatococcus lobatus TaxID=904363 RepID=A0AAW1S2E5_9CHLO
MKRPSDEHETHQVLLPLVAVHEQVLLPTAIVRIALPASFRRSSALVDHLLTLQGKDHLVAVVPLLADTGHGSSAARRVKSVDYDSLDVEALNSIATAARIIQLTRMAQTGDWVVTLEGLHRLRLGKVSISYPREFWVALATAVDDGAESSFKAAEADKQVEDAAIQLKQSTRQLIHLMQQLTGSVTSASLLEALDQMPPARASDMLASILASAADRLAVLNATSTHERLQTVLVLVQQAQNNIMRAAVAAQQGKAGSSKGRRGQADALRRLQVARMQLQGKQKGGDDKEEDDEAQEVVALLKRIKAAHPPPEILKVATREAKRLQRSNENHPGHAMARGYLETLADLPWNSLAVARPGSSSASSASSTASRPSADSHADPQQQCHSPSLLARLDAASEGRPLHRDPSQPPGGSLEAARVMLHEQHHGLDKVKERIIQYLAVRRLRGWDTKAPILCFIGPPGVGKTSLARSIAAVLGRPFHRISLGGVRDEAEIRGHRRTYIGAMPGRIIQGLRRVGVRDPVILLDEVDKMNADGLRGDPSAALLEVLDPEQNGAFVDTYLGVPFDLSQVIFVATGNRLSEIPAPLLDRLEVISLPGYTQDEKVHIAEKHLIPQLLEEHGLTNRHLSFPQPILHHITRGYTREAGVRALNRSLAAISRHTAVSIVSGAESRTGGGHHAEAPQITEPEVENDHEQQNPHLYMDSSAAILADEPAPGPSSWRQSLYESFRSLRGQHPVQPVSAASSPQPSATEDRHHMQQHAAWQSPSGSSVPLLGGLLGGRRSQQQSSKAADPNQLDRRRRHSLWTSRQTARRFADGEPTEAEQRQEDVVSDNHSEQQESSVRAEALRQREWLLQSVTSLTEVDEELVEVVLGPPKFTDADAEERIVSPGSAAGLVWTSVGGAVQYVECCCVGRGQSDRQGRLMLTGQVGEVLEESASIALSWIRSHAGQISLGQPGSHGSSTSGRAELAETSGRDALPAERSQEQSNAPAAATSSSGLEASAARWDIHVHLPAGAVQKDGPSAGITLAAALASLFAERCARADTAMTGELTLRGLVLPVGGIKEKLLAAHQAGIKRVLVPRRTMRDVKADVPASVKESMKILPVDRLEDVLRLAFDPPILFEASARL